MRVPLFPLFNNSSFRRHFLFTTVYEQKHRFSEKPFSRKENRRKRKASPRPKKQRETEKHPLRKKPPEITFPTVFILYSRFPLRYISAPAILPPVTFPYNLRAFQNGLEPVKLDRQRQCAIQNGMRIVGGWRFRRLSVVLGRPCTDSVQPEGVSKRFR